MDNTGYQYLEEGMERVYELLEKTCDDFMGTDYEKGRKDGLRLALALMGDVDQRKLVKPSAQATKFSQLQEWLEGQKKNSLKEQAGFAKSSKGSWFWGGCIQAYEKAIEQMRRL
jgi:hypothetical protein